MDERHSSRLSRVFIPTKMEYALSAEYTVYLVEIVVVKAGVDGNRVVDVIDLVAVGHH